MYTFQRTLQRTCTLSSLSSCLILRLKHRGRAISSSTSISYSPLKTGHVAHLTITTTRKVLIADPPLLRLVHSSLVELPTNSPSSTSPLRAVFLRSTITGADLNVMKSLTGPEEAKGFIQHISTLCAEIQDFKCPVIQIVDGACMGAGMEVAAACDVRIAVEGSLFAMPETKVGIPSVVHASLIPSLIGWGRARELLLFGEHIDAATAFSWGFVNEVVPRSALEETIKKWENKIDATGVRALNAQKALMRIWEEGGTGRTGVEAGVEAFGEAFKHSEPSTMMQSFFDAKKLRKGQA